MNIDWSLLPPGSRVLCALSGGADSVCLLHLLTKAARERELTVFAAHCEHGLRGEESLRDMDFVRALCDSLSVPLTVKRVDVPAYAAANGLGTEEAARQLRYAFLEESADALGCDRIATAHNAGDRSETMLMNLCRGSGAAGLRGIPRQRGRIVRPLLDAERREILAYLAENGLELSLFGGIQFVHGPQKHGGTRSCRFCARTIPVSMRAWGAPPRSCVTTRTV